MYYLTEEDFLRAEANGIERRYAYNRYYHQHWDIERALTQPVIKKPKNTEIAKWRKVAESNGIVRGTFYERVRRGMSYEEAATKPVMPLEERLKLAREKSPNNKKRVITPEQLAIAKQNGICYETAKARVKRNMPVEEAITRPVEMKHSIHFHRRKEAQRA